MPVTKASLENAPKLVQLINRAYRGPSSEKGWTTEASIIGGEYRILQEELEALMHRPGVCFLQSLNDAGETEGCVFLEQRGKQLYLGMLSVDPDIQARGTGKRLMQAAEEHAHALELHSIIMRVIHLRKELIDWYIRRGYHDTGLTESYTPTPYEIVKIPFHFVVLQKNL